jgi:hypothetical protein
MFSPPRRDHGESRMETEALSTVSRPSSAARTPREFILIFRAALILCPTTGGFHFFRYSKFTGLTFMSDSPNEATDGGRGLRHLCREPLEGRPAQAHSSRGSPCPIMASRGPAVSPSGPGVHSPVEEGIVGMPVGRSILWARVLDRPRKRAGPPPACDQASARAGKRRAAALRDEKRPGRAEHGSRRVLFSGATGLTLSAS